MSRKLTTDEVVARFKEINGSRYDYSEFVYVDSQTKGKIICPLHGEFWQSSNVHSKGVQCPKCVVEGKKGSTKKLSADEVFERCKLKHGDRYSYDFGGYVNIKSKIRIKCPLHGWFEQTASNHMNGQGCPECGNEIKRRKMSLTLDDFIERASDVHGNRYDYSLVSFGNNKEYVKIICPVHGVFEQRVDQHLIGKGCPKCDGKNRTTEDFVIEAKTIHGERYDYSEVDYIDSEHKVVIKCNECGNVFSQKPWSHLQGHGCPLCKLSRGENEIERFLTEKNIRFTRQKRFEWLGRMSLDFYLEDYNVAIEVHGEQHFNDKTKFGSVNYGKIHERDRKKYLLCNEKGIKVLYYVAEKFKIPSQYFDKIYTDKEEMLETFYFAHDDMFQGNHLL